MKYAISERTSTPYALFGDIKSRHVDFLVQGIMSAGKAVQLDTFQFPHLGPSEGRSNNCRMLEYKKLDRSHDRKPISQDNINRKPGLWVFLVCHYDAFPGNKSPQTEVVCRIERAEAYHIQGRMPPPYLVHECPVRLNQPTERSFAQAFFYNRPLALASVFN